MGLIVFAIFSLICILICSMAFYKKGVAKGKSELIFYREYNYEVIVKSDRVDTDKKYQLYHWDMNVEQTIGVGDFISYDKPNMSSALRRDYGTDYFKVIARRIIESDKSSKATLIVCPASKAELNVLH